MINEKRALALTLLIVIFGAAKADNNTEAAQNIHYARNTEQFLKGLKPDLHKARAHDCEGSPLCTQGMLEQLQHLLALCIGYQKEIQDKPDCQPYKEKFATLMTEIEQEIARRNKEIVANLVDEISRKPGSVSQFLEDNYDDFEKRFANQQ